MKIKYGTFEFEPGEATLRDVVYRSNYSPRGFKTTKTIEFHVEGDVVADGQYNVHTRLTQIENALAADGFDFGLFHDNGTATTDYLESANPLNLTGNQIFYRRFPNGEGGEHVTGRTFAFGVKAVLADYESSIIEYRDSVRRVGNGGPIADWQDTPKGPYVRQVSPSSIVTIIHSGRAVNAAGYMMPPAPYFQVPFYLGHLEDVQQIGPDKYPQAVVNYTTTWNYIYKLPAMAFVAPSIR